MRSFHNRPNCIPFIMNSVFTTVKYLRAPTDRPSLRLRYRLHTLQEMFLKCIIKLIFYTSSDGLAAIVYTPCRLCSVCDPNRGQGIHAVSPPHGIELQPHRYIVPALCKP